MTTSVQPLPVIALPGLRTDVLGNYLASLGLLRLLSRRWPSVRIAWRDGVLQVVGGPDSLDELLKELMCIAKCLAWTRYERSWAEKQKESTKKQSGRPVALWLAAAKEEAIELFYAHAVPHERLTFNRLLGSGGNAGRRDFAKGWKAAVDALHKQPQDSKRDELHAWLLGQPVSWMRAGLGAASWFSSANKLYNSGQEKPFREQPLSPWAMALACEGLPFFAGAASRRLGARARVQGAFPFVCQAAAPRAAGEAGRDRGEVWAPIWERPMTLPEVRALFQRGRAEVRGHGANTPAAFGAAIIQRGVDAGICGFVRFGLGRTTSDNTFEPRYEGRFDVQPVNAAGRSVTVERLLALIERLPADRKVGKRWRFIGLRGLIEAALLRVAREPGEPEAARTLLDATATVLDRVDRNTSHRKARVAWQPLPLKYLLSLFRNEAPGAEARLAMALVSSFPPARPFTLYRFGVERRYGRYERFEHPERAPAQWIWGPGPLARVLAEVVVRSTLDREKERDGGNEAGARRKPVAAAAADVQRWLDGAVDEALLARWLGRLALFDWGDIPQDEWSRPHGSPFGADGTLLLAGLLQPLFDARPLRVGTAPERGDVFAEETGARTPGTARSIAVLLRTGRADAAVRLAQMRYAMAGVPLICARTIWDVADPDRLLASMLFAIADHDRSSLAKRWLRPQRGKGERANA